MQSQLRCSRLTPGNTEETFKVWPTETNMTVRWISPRQKRGLQKNQGEVRDCVVIPECEVMTLVMDNETQRKSSLQPVTCPIDDTGKCHVKFGDSPKKVLEVLRSHMDLIECKVIIAEGWCKKCGVCISICPVKALRKDKEGFPQVQNEKCISCGTCEILCPDFAIIVRELGRKKEK